MGVPKRKTSKMKLRHRRSSNSYNHYKDIGFLNCKNCGAIMQLHRICVSCGYYKDKQILVMKK